MGLVLQINCLVNEALCLSVRQQQGQALSTHWPASTVQPCFDRSVHSFIWGVRGRSTAPWLRHLSLSGQLVHIRAESFDRGQLALSSCARISTSSELKWLRICHREPEMAPPQSECYTAVSSHSRKTLSYVLPLYYCPMPPASLKLFIPCSTQDARMSLETGETDKVSDGCIMIVQLIGLSWLLGSCLHNHCSLASCRERRQFGWGGTEGHCLPAWWWMELDSLICLS